MALELPPATLTALHQLGMRRVRDCLRLPRDGLNRRLGTEVVDYLDRATGHRTDPQSLFQPPDTFSSHLLLPAEVEDANGLRFAMHRLLVVREDGEVEKGIVLERILRRGSQSDASLVECRRPASSVYFPIRKDRRTRQTGRDDD